MNSMDHNRQFEANFRKSEKLCISPLSGVAVNDVMLLHYNGHILIGIL